MAAKAVEPHAGVRVTGSAAPAAGQILEALAHAVVVTDLAGTVTYWNAAAARVYGVPSDDAVGRPFDSLLPAGLDAGATAARQRVALGEEVATQVSVYRPDGSVSRVLVVDSPLYDRTGAVAAVVSCATDLDRAARAERLPAPDEPTTEDAEVVARIRQMYEGGASMNTIAAALNAEGLRAPGGRRWHASSIARTIAVAE